MEANLFSGLTLAYIGDAVYEVKIRERLLNENLTKINDLHKKAVCYTNANFQAKLLRHLISNNLLDEGEIVIYKRGRNSNVKLTRKNLKLSEYLDATGFEALVGYLYLSKQISRLDELIKIVFEII